MQEKVPASAVSATEGARRLSTMLRHSSHTIMLVLWVVAAAQSWSDRTHLQLALGLLLAAAYLTGLIWQARHPHDERHRVAGRLWVTVMVLVWAVLAGLSATWSWLVFPLFFLVLFIVPAPWCWVGVAGMALWCGISGLVRGEVPALGQVLGPLLGAVVAVVAWLVFQQLRSDIAEQRRLTEQVRTAQSDLLLAESQRARLEERDRLARDLHDTLAQGLNSIVMLSRSAAGQHPQASGELELIEQTARTNLAQARSLVRELARPTTDLAQDLASTVADTAARESAIGSGLHVDLNLDGQPRALPALVHDAALKAVRGLLANVVQHANAGRCVVSLGWHEEGISVDVVDDGDGFSQTMVPEGYGLQGLRQRVGALGGHCEVRSAPGDGTSVGIWLPYRRQGARRMED